MTIEEYITRIFEQLNNVLSNVRLSWRQDNLNEANLLLDTACKELIGLEYAIIKGLSQEKLFDIINLNRRDLISAAKLIVTAKLLFEKARVEEERNRKGGDVFYNYQKSLYLYIEGYSLAGESSACRQYLPDIDTILQKFPYEELPAELNSRLFDYYKKAGEYGAAENVLFYLKDINYPGIQEEGKQFFAELEKMCDEELAKAHFTKEKIKSGMESLQGLQA